MMRLSPRAAPPRPRLAARLLLAALLAGPAGAADGAEEEGGARARLGDWLAAHRSLRAGFHQSVFDEDGLRIGEARGTVVLRRPYRFRWEYEAPEAQTVVADGVTLWWYDADLAQVTARPAPAALAGTPAVLLAGAGRLDEHFQATPLPSAGGIDWIELSPLDPEAAFRMIRVGMHGRELRLIEMEDGFGQTSRIELFDVESNPRLTDEVFRFRPPPGTDVVRDE